MNDAFIARTLGTVTLSEAGRCTLSVKPTAMPHSAVMNLESVTLKPRGRVQKLHSALACQAARPVKRSPM